MTDKICSGLAIMVRPLVFYYDRQKKALQTLLREVLGPGTDYDTLRKGGVNPRHLLPQTLTRERRTKILAILDDLEAIAPGLLILLRKDLFPIMLNHEYNLLDSTNALINPPSIEEEEREKFVSELRAQETYSAAYKENCVELFRVLCGELDGLSKNGVHAKGLTELNAMAVIMFQDTELQPLVRGDHAVMMVDCGNGCGVFRLVRHSLASKFLPHYPWSYDPFTAMSLDLTTSPELTMTDLVESSEPDEY